MMPGDGGLGLRQNLELFPARQNVELFRGFNLPFIYVYTYADNKLLRSTILHPFIMHV